MNNVYQELLERAGFAKPGSNVKRDHPALYRAAKRAVMIVGGTWAERVRLLYEMENGGKQMSDKTITVPADAQSVTLNIERRSERPEGMTLRQALLATPSDRAVVVRVVDCPLVNDKPLAWDMFLPAVGNRSDNDESRRARTTQFASCELCDVPVLLDEREVKRVDVRYGTHGTDYVVFEVENDA